MKQWEGDRFGFMSLMLHPAIANRSNMITHRRRVNDIIRRVAVECDRIKVQIQGGAMLWQDVVVAVHLTGILATVAVGTMLTVLRGVIHLFE